MRGSWLKKAVAVSTAVVFGVVGGAVAGASVFHGHWIGGRIEEAYHRLGGWNTFGDATTDELVAGNNGRFQVFVRDASIYWHAGVDNGVAHQVGGRIRNKWGDLGWETAALGYPITDELTTPDGTGKFNHFQGGSIYWSQPSGIHIITGPIRDFWGENGWERGFLKFPTSEEYKEGGGIKQDFQGGSVQYFKPTGRALPVFDNKKVSSYRQIYPLFTTADLSRWHAAGAYREVIQNMDKYFPLKGCPDEITEGAVCTFSGVGGVTGKVTVDRISDKGFSLVTASDHPEGAGRVLNVRFDEITAPSTGEKDLIFDTDAIRVAYTGTDKTWVRLVVESFGSTQATRVQGPLISDHVGRQVWGKFAGTLRNTIDGSTTTYIPLTN